LKPVIQEDLTGCGIASVAALANRTYAEVKHAARRLGIEVSDPQLWSETTYVRRLLDEFKISALSQKSFVSWDSLPDRALLAIKWHREKSGPAWHWVTFARDASGSCVLDPKKKLRSNRRTDFGRMKPKWFLEVQSKSFKGKSKSL